MLFYSGRNILVGDIKTIDLNVIPDHLMAQGSCLNLFPVDNRCKTHFKVRQFNVCRYCIGILSMFKNQKGIFDILIIDVVIEYLLNSIL